MPADRTAQRLHTVQPPNPGVFQLAIAWGTITFSRFGCESRIMAISLAASQSAASPVEEPHAGLPVIRQQLTHLAVQVLDVLLMCLAQALAWVPRPARVGRRVPALDR